MDTQSRHRLQHVLQAKAFVFDVDGTLTVSDGADWRGAVALPGAVDLLTWLRQSGRPYVLFTNGSTEPPAVYAERLRAAGLPIDDWQMITPGVTAAEIIAHEYPGRAVLVLGTDGVRAPLTERMIPIVDMAEAEQAGVVLVGWDTVITYEQIEAASRAIWSGADLLVTSLAPVFVTKRGPRPGWSGSVAAAITWITGKEARVTGKPAPEGLRAIARMLDLRPEDLTLVGDDLDLELRMGHEAGSATVLVRTGTSADAAVTGDVPDLAVHQLTELLAMLQEEGIQATADDREDG